MQIVFFIIFIFVIMAAFRVLQFLFPVILLIIGFTFIKRALTGTSFGSRQDSGGGDPNPNYEPYRNQKDAVDEDFNPQYYDHIPGGEDPLDDRPVSVRDEEFFEKQHQVLDVPYVEEKSDTEL